MIMDKRNKDIIKLVSDGELSLNEIAKKYGITRSRVKTIYDRYKSKESLETADDDFSKLYRLLKKDARSTNAVWRMGIRDVNELKRIYECGDILKIRNVGEKSLELIGECLKENNMIEKTDNVTDYVEEIDMRLSKSDDATFTEIYLERKKLKDFLNHSLAYRCLVNYGITSIKLLKEAYEKDPELTEILAIRSIGINTVDHIKRCLGWKPDADIISESLRELQTLCLNKLEKGKSYTFEGRFIGNQIYDVILTYNKCASNHYLDVNVHYFDDVANFDNYFFTWFLQYNIEIGRCKGKPVTVKQMKLLMRLLDDIKEELIKEQPCNTGKPDWEICYFCDKKDSIRCKPYDCNPEEI